MLFVSTITTYNPFANANRHDVIEWKIEKIHHNSQKYTKYIVEMPL